MTHINESRRHRQSFKDTKHRRRSCTFSSGVRILKKRRIPHKRRAMYESPLKISPEIKNPCKNRMKIVHYLTIVRSIMLLHSKNMQKKQDFEESGVRRQNSEYSSPKTLAVVRQIVSTF